ncbi:hypothetical protein HWV62_1557 [Athelia sp. TMB]|nr:hypothetical protein HWV62_1557 [Athelia sp. TMB]
MPLTSHPNLQRMLESVRAAPDDILIAIFLAFTASKDRDDSTSSGPILLGSVCARWRALTLSVSALWSSIRIVVPRAAKFADAGALVRLFADRSGVMPLHVSVAISTPNHASFWPVGTSPNNTQAQCAPLIDALAATAARWQSFSLRSPRPLLWAVEDALARPCALPRLERLDVREQHFPPWLYKPRPAAQRVGMFAACPRLRRVRACLLHGQPRRVMQLPMGQLEEWDRLEGDAEELMRLLREAPRLGRCGAQVQLGRVPLSAGTVRHALRALDVSFEGTGDVGDMDEFFQRIELPELTELRVEVFWAHFSAPTRFTSLLAAPSALRKLAITLRPQSIPPVDLHLLLEEVPGVEEFEFRQGAARRGYPSAYTAEMLERLTLDAGSDKAPLLPNLRVLILLGHIDIRDTKAFTAMIRSRTSIESVTVARCAVLQSLRLCVQEQTCSFTMEDLGAIKKILGDKADLKVVSRRSSSMRIY